jgi:hypothetical protein
MIMVIIMIALNETTNLQSLVGLGGMRNRCIDPTDYDSLGTKSDLQLEVLYLFGKVTLD